MKATQTVLVLSQSVLRLTSNCVYVHEACDYLGETLASLLGITTPKYQYAIDEYYRMKKEV